MPNPHLESNSNQDYIFNPISSNFKKNKQSKINDLASKVGSAFSLSTTENQNQEQEQEQEQEDRQERIQTERNQSMSQSAAIADQRELDRNVRENIRLEKRMRTIQVATPLSLLVNVTSVGICTFAFGNHGLDWVNRKHVTYFSPSSRLLGLYWAVLYFLMVGFSVLAVISRKRETKQLLTSSIGPNLAIANFLMALWAPLWLLDKHWTFLVGEVLLGINALLLLWSSVVLGVWYAPVLSHPLDWAFVHVPVKMFFAVTFQLDLWQQLFIVLGWEEENLPKSIWPTFGISIGISLLFSLWIFATGDVTLTVASIYLHVCSLRFRKTGVSNRPAELIASSILSITLLVIAIFSNFAWSRLQKRNEGRIALPIDQEEERRIRGQNQGRESGIAGGTGVGVGESSYRDEEGVVIRDPTPAEVEEGRNEDGVKVTRKIGGQN